MDTTPTPLCCSSLDTKTVQHQWFCFTSLTSKSKYSYKKQCNFCTKDCWVLLSSHKDSLISYLWQIVNSIRVFMVGPKTIFSQKECSNVINMKQVYCNTFLHHIIVQHSCSSKNLRKVYVAILLPGKTAWDCITHLGMQTIPNVSKVMQLTAKNLFELRKANISYREV